MRQETDHPRHIQEAGHPRNTQEADHSRIRQEAMPGSARRKDPLHPSGRPLAAPALRPSQKELHPHGTTRFPCAAYTTACTDTPEGIVPWHWHAELEIVLVRDGGIEWRTPGTVHTCARGDLIVLNRNTLHYATGTPAATLQSLVFSPRLLTGSTSLVFWEKYMQPLISSSAFTCTVLSGDEDCSRSFLTAFEAFSAQPFAYEFTIREALTRILLSMYRRYEDRLASAQSSLTIDSERIEKMLTYIHTHYPENISLEEISRAGQIGKRECLRCFARTITESPMQYLLKYRLMECANLLVTQPGTGISALAQDCGFDSPSYFSKQFRRVYQCTPGEYRKSRLGTAPR